MEPFRFHVFAYDQQKPEGAPCCAARGSVQVLEALRREVIAHGLEDEVQVTSCGSLGLCEHGPARPTTTIAARGGCGYGEGVGPVGATCAMTYTVHRDGEIQVECCYKPGTEKLSTMPRFGTELVVAPGFENLAWRRAPRR